MGNSKQDTTGGYNAGYYGRIQCRMQREDTKAGYKHETTGEYYAGYNGMIQSRIQREDTKQDTMGRSRIQRGNTKQDSTGGYKAGYKRKMLWVSRCDGR